jgi:hypothetical protein
MIDSMFFLGCILRKNAIFKMIGMCDMPRMLIDGDDILEILPGILDQRTVVSYKTT